MEFVDESSVELVKCNAKDIDVARAAWVSNNGKNYPSDLETSPYNLKHDLNWWSPNDVNRVQSLINFLYRERHMSPFEHGSFTFLIDTPIFVAREFMRHRTFSYNEVSGRYKELSPRFYLINDDRPVVQKGKVGAYEFDGGTPEQYGTTYAATTLAYGSSWAAYQKMLDIGVAREVARNVLPVGIMTQFYATCNPRNLMQFLQLRDDSNALYEIRQVAEKMRDIFEEKMPMTYAAYSKYDYRDERAELKLLRAKVAQMEAEETYRDNILVG